jgi:hypothetical protein
MTIVIYDHHIFIVQANGLIYVSHFTDERHDIWQNDIKNNGNHHNEAHHNDNEHCDIYSDDIQHNKTWRNELALGIMN